MTGPVILLTDRSAFADRWRSALERGGLVARVVPPAQLVEQELRDATVVLDASAAHFDEDELLATVGLVRALRSTAVVELPDNGAMRGIEDVVDDMCPGLVVRNAAEAERVAASLARRLDTARARRFEYVTVSPRQDGLLAILADGNAELLPRPVAAGDDGSEVSSIALGEDARTATLQLASGASFVVKAQQCLRANGARSSTPPAGGTNIALDGARLGARLRELRVAAGLTQAELARRTGIHRPNIARVEAGRHTPSLETLARLASAIGVPTTSVLAEE
jgi:DNA-binding XRE family transcriptional regulator